MSKYICFFIPVLFVILHLSYIYTPFVNFEWVYRLGSDYFITGDKWLLEQYFFGQANPLTYSFVVSLLASFFDIDQFAIYRIPALLGGFILLFVLSKYHNPLLVLIVALNPLIWIYSGRAYSEMFSVGMMMLALMTYRNGFVKGLLGAFAAIIKYHSIVVIGCYWGLRWFNYLIKKKPKAWKDKNFLAGVVSICGLIAFFLIYYQEFGIWILPDKFKLMLPFSYLNAINNFFSYGFYLGGMFFLTIPYLLLNTPWRWQLALIMISIPLAIMNQNNGEMDFGSFNQILSEDFIVLIKMIGFWNFFLCCKIFWNDDKSRILLLTVLLYVVLLSMTRPAQRYLIFVIPFWAIMICLRLEIHRVVQVGNVLILCVLNLFATLYQVQNARASAEIAAWSQSKDIQINSAVIYPHVGIFSHHDPKSKITVTMNPKPNDKILFSRAVKIFNYPLREYFVVQPIDAS
jgi:hypothetical protein